MKKSFNDFEPLTSTCADSSGNRLHLLVHHHRLGTGEHLNVWRQIPAVQNRVEGGVRPVNKHPEEMEITVKKYASFSIGINNWMNEQLW